jgi:hypothetical protein
MTEKRGKYRLEVPLDASGVGDLQAAEQQDLRVVVKDASGATRSTVVKMGKERTASATLDFESRPDALTVYVGPANATDEELLAEAGQLALLYTDPEKFREQQRAERQKVQAETRQKRNAARPLYRELKLAQRANNAAKVQEIRNRLLALGLQPPGARAGRGVTDLARSSDLPSPAPDGHLLREMGQSERELIGEAHADPTVPQVLALLNAFIEQKILTNPDAALMRSLADARGAATKVRTAFVAVLGRAPTPAERSMWERELSRDGTGAARDLVWTLVNSHEFLFIQ